MKSQPLKMSWTCLSEIWRYNSIIDSQSLKKKPKQTVSLCSLIDFIVAIVNPFDLTTDNMSRIDGFNLYMPRRICFNLDQ